MDMEEPVCEQVIIGEGPCPEAAGAAPSAAHRRRSSLLTAYLLTHALKKPLGLMLFGVASAVRGFQNLTRRSAFCPTGFPAVDEYKLCGYVPGKLICKICWKTAGKENI